MVKRKIKSNKRTIKLSGTEKATYNYVRKQGLPKHASLQIALGKKEYKRRVR